MALLWLALLGCSSEISPKVCLDELESEQDFEIDAVGPDTQIHASATFDGDGVWVAYNLPNEAGAFEVFTTHLRCDGSVDVAPAKRGPSQTNQIDPAIAADGEGGVTVAWQSDNQATTDNLDIWTEAATEDAGFSGGAIYAESEVANFWMPKVVPAGRGETVLVGSWSDLAVPWGVFAQRLDGSGASTGPRAAVFSELAEGQLYPDAALDGDDRLHVVWEQHEAESVTVYRSASLEGELAGNNRAPLGPGAAPSVDAYDDYVWFAYSTDEDSPDVVVTSLEGVELFLGGSGADFGASVVADRDGGGAVAWYENVSGFSNRIHLARFDASGAVVDETLLETESAAPYGLDLVRIDDGLYFLAWQDGQNPAFRARGRFIELD